MTRVTVLKRAILDRLHAAAPYALPEAQLTTEVNGTVRPPAKPAELKTAITELSRASLIAELRDALDTDSLKWVITEAGEAALLK